MKLANSSSIDAPADEVSHRQTTCCGNPSLSSGPSGKPPPPPPFPPQTSSSQNKFDVSAPRKIPNHVTPLLRAVFKRCRHYYFEGKISDTPVLDENCILRYINVDTEFQRGPTCGIVALKMIASLICDVETDSILRAAQDRSFTHRGEMFCAKNMFELAKDVVGSEACQVEFHENIFPSNEAQVWELLAQNVIFLVPYDVDKDNSPGCFGGKKAHWAALTGLAKINVERFVFGFQGKSAHTAAWPLSDLSRSNSQLHEFDPAAACTECVHETFALNLKGHAISFKFSEDTKIKCIYGIRI
ncbi:Chromosome 19 open reading frame 54 [Nesidiocoris tenuis]|uniref:Actin maturation protease n=1 Tax=Nesidiocoris tenuis TaxID=355587 RepID=A0ABN7AID4_9HEMI|nr:Chromosome 19 open reading frame 54 [Nesidiocoris tenuis]